MKRACRQPRARGLTLVELLVAMGLGLFLVVVMGTIFLGSKGTFQSQNHVARLQESARFSVDTLSADLRMAGFQGCRGLGLTTPMLNTLNTPTAFLYNFAQGVWASRHNGSAWGPALASTLTSLSPAPDSAGDVLTVRRAVGTGWSLTAEMGSATAALNVTSTGRITTGDLLMVSDCAGAAVFQATNATPGVSGSIEHSASVTATPGVSTNSLGRPFLQDAVVYRLTTVTYYLAPSQREDKTTQLALWSFTTPDYNSTEPPKPQELVTGVEGFRVTLGLDSNGDGAADAYVAPKDVPDWTQVITARIELLMASTEDNITSSPQPYTFAGTASTPSDRRLRTVVSTVVQVRNALR